MTTTPPPPPPATPPPPPPVSPPPPQQPGVPPPSMTPAERFRMAYGARAQTDYYFEGMGMVIFLTIITCGIFGFYVFYQLMKRMRDHNRRRLDLLESATELACNGRASRASPRSCDPTSSASPRTWRCCAG